jgi:hypothetical protein
MSDACGATRRRRSDARGSLAVEYVIVAPLFLIVFGLIFAFARVSQLDGLLDAGARDAARAVSIAPNLSAGDVLRVAQESVRDELGSGAGGCNQDNVQVQVDGLDPDTGEVVSAGDLEPGEIARVTVTCRYSLSDLGVPVPGLSGLKASAVFASIIDPDRSQT